MSAYTKGEWVAELDPSSGYVRVLANYDVDTDDEGRAFASYTYICDVIDNDDEQGNARLIAAAPDLLAVLKKIAASTFYIGTVGTMREAVDAAIAKAEAA